MDRRTFLAGAGGLSLGAVSLAGCLGARTARLREGGVVRDRGEATLPFRDDSGVEVARFTAEYGRLRPGRWELALNAWHDDRTRLSSMTYEFRFPGPSPTVYLDRPDGGPWPPIRFTGTADRTTLAVDDVGELGEGSVGVRVLFGTTGPVDRLPVRVLVDYALVRPTAGSAPGRYEAEGSVRLTLPGSRG